MKTTPMYSNLFKFNLFNSMGGKKSGWLFDIMEKNKNKPLD